MIDSPHWLTRLERKAPWLRSIGIPNLAIPFVTLKVLGFLLIMSEPAWVERLALIPWQVLQGHEYWRLITFLSLPFTLSPLWMLLALWFIYSILNSLESVWGDFKTTFYLLISVVITITYSLVFGYPVLHVRDFEWTLFLAAATLFPEQQVLLFFFPVKMKWLAWITVAFAALAFARGDWLDRGYLLAIYSNFFLFFGPAQLDRLKNWRRRREYQRRMRQ